MRSRRKNLIYRIIIIVFSICFLYNGKATVFSQNTQEEQPRKVKVGFFAFDGYHNMDENGNKSGYGYEVLQLMKRYENWQYEYVGYDKDWADMLSMLENGEIDMLTSAGKTAERLERFDYSDVNIGTNSVILTVRKDETRFITGHYKDYNGMKVGLLRENEKNEFFEENALQKGFTYQPIYYDNTDELKEALQTTKEIDAIATSSIRKLYHEKILEDFNPSEFFVIVKKGNKELLSEINNALLHINADDPGWRNRLEEEYYNLDSSRNFSFTEEDKYLLEKIKKDKKVVKVLVNPDNAPYSYLKNGEIAGVLPDLFAKMIKIVKIPYEYLPVTTVEEYRKELQKQRADIILDSTMSLQEIENMDMSAVGTRLSTSLTILYKRNSNKFF